MSQVLLVDDDPVLLEVLATALDLEEFSVATATDGASALAVADRERPDVVVCDVAMPEMDGLEVCRRLKSSPRTGRIPVVLLAVRGDTQDRAAGQDAGCDGYLTKPFNPLRLIDMLRELA